MVRRCPVLRGLNFCLLLPGPEAHQLVTWLGWRMHGPVGGLAAGLLFVLPGALVMYALTLAYLHFERAPAMEGALYGLRAVVVALVGQALFRMAKRVLRDTPRRCWQSWPAGRSCATCHTPGRGFGRAGGVRLFPTTSGAVGPQPVLIEHHVVRPVTILGVLQTLVIGLTLWWGPVLAAGVLLGPDHRLVREGLYFGRLATLSFGGAYAVLAWIRQEAVEDLGWLSTREMADALSLAETTPGPLILVTQFVGSLAAARHPEPLSPMWAATLGALLTTWVTFAPSFLWIALGRDWVDRVPETSPASRAMDECPLPSWASSRPSD